MRQRFHFPGRLPLDNIPLRGDFRKCLRKISVHAFIQPPICDILFLLLLAILEAFSWLLLIQVSEIRVWVCWPRSKRLITPDYVLPPRNSKYNPLSSIKPWTMLVVRVRLWLGFDSRSGRRVYSERNRSPLFCHSTFDWIISQFLLIFNGFL